MNKPDFRTLRTDVKAYTASVDLRSDWAHWKYFDAYDAEAQVSYHTGNKSTIILATTFTWSQVRQLSLVVWCSLFGHDIEDIGYAGPDSGAMDFVCTRCGWNQHIQLY